MAQTDEGHGRDAQRATIQLLRLLYDIGAFSLPDDPNVYDQIERLLDEAEGHANAIRVRGDAARKRKETA